MKAVQCIFAILVVITVVVSTSHADDDGEYDQTLVVRTSKATFRGKRIDVNPYLLPDFRGSTAAYTSIPYAEPPVGELRFRRPVPMVIEGEFDATRSSVACAQAAMPPISLDSMGTSEDCLTLDIFVPEPKPSSAAVMVWIHGGGYSIGAGSIPESLPIPLAVMNDVIVVTINYRLGVFGFAVLGEEDVSDANAGMLDQHQALVWVQENIAAFGGDPSRVTIFGESAGAMSVSLHVVSPMSKGLFSGAIFQSGAATSQWTYSSLEDGEETALAYSKAFNCSKDTHRESIECLRGLAADDITNFLSPMPPELYIRPLRPFVDGVFLPRDPREMYKSGDVNQVSIITGCLSDEGMMTLIPQDGKSTEPQTFNRTTFQGTIALTIKNSDELVMDTIELVYMSPEEMAKEEPDYTDVTVNCMGDYFFLCPSFQAADYLSSAGLPTYKYIMTHKPSSSIWGKELSWLGATHGEDLPYTLGTPFMLESLEADAVALTGLFNEEEVDLAVQVMKYWANFAKTGNPNLSSRDAEPDTTYPQWGAYSVDNKTYKDISLSLDNRVGYPNLQSCKLVNDLLPKLQANAAEMARLKSLLAENVMADGEKTCQEGACPEA